MLYTKGGASELMYIRDYGMGLTGSLHLDPTESASLSADLSHYVIPSNFKSLMP